jgi:hypothetical protein
MRAPHPIAHFVAAALLSIGFAPLLALAHSPYLLPNYFDVTQRDHVTVEASFAETLFVPDFVMRSDNFHVVTPEGRRVPLASVQTRDLAILEAETTQPGTYRFSSGRREGRRARAVLRAGEWVPLARDERPTDGLPEYEMLSVTCAEVYVSRGAPGGAALEPRGTGLEYRMVSNPGRLFAGASADLVVLFDGRPLAAQPITVVRVGGATHQPGKETTVVADAAGRARVPLAEPGIYHLMSRHRFAVPGAARKAESHTYALTLEVTE